MSRRKGVLCAVACMALLFGIGAVSAHADTLLYTFTPTTGSHGFSFVTPSNPVLATASTSTSFLAIVGGSADGVELGHSLATFFTQSAGGGLDFIGNCDLFPSIPSNACQYSFVNGPGARPALFTGPTSSPTLFTDTLLTVFDVTVTQDGTAGPTIGEEGVLTITDLAPEPSSWVLLATGLLGLMGVARFTARLKTGPSGVGVLRPIGAGPLSVMAVSTRD